MNKVKHTPTSEFECSCGKDFSEYEHGKRYLKGHLKDVVRRPKGVVRIPVVRAHVELRHAKMLGMPDET